MWNWLNRCWRIKNVKRGFSDLGSESNYQKQLWAPRAGGTKGRCGGYILAEEPGKPELWPLRMSPASPLLVSLSGSNEADSGRTAPTTPARVRRHCGTPLRTANRKPSPPAAPPAVSVHPAPPIDGTWRTRLTKACRVLGSASPHGAQPRGRLSWVYSVSKSSWGEGSSILRGPLKILPVLSLPSSKNTSFFSITLDHFS